MVLKLEVDGYENCVKSIDEHKTNGKGMFLLFSGSKDSAGTSWCPDCEAADPVIEKALKTIPEDAVFLHVHVGDRNFWKDKNNPFRKDPQLSLKCVPTLIKYGTPLRLEESQCAELETVQMLFEEM